ncbi:MAG: molybdopterin molybdotransferase MoeA [Gammaproteobacteria bacterium]|nr:molybdopterin molybdotransferase MoeA [Gammaproteobacteria bacterium]MBU2056461.1 molybdopterin molybdotransferase MoeA [Gammaproteobacteria bacterium]MBU2173826.1 molybdopterin molybdotransferase MoeA [Gammaproteobacteria bacterium]MBU2248889.1 molybdopterin molybdotransferase MoeA [Gammaproteobacteria bacterium]MBU2344011.1 molybdopterin molybdotransferase MoeA [Gammaproteobacteria bacterium]
MSHSACLNQQSLTLAEALQLMLSEVSAPIQRQYCPLPQLLDRVVAEPVYSPVAMPAFTQSAMDGYALRYEDIKAGAAIELVGTVLAGQQARHQLQAGQAMAVMTGAAIPEGADTVLMQEYCVVEQGKLRFDTDQPYQQGDHIRWLGEDLQAGALLFAAGHRMGALDLAVLAASGLAGAQVYNKLKVAYCSSGDELTEPGQALKPGFCYDANRYLLQAALKRLDCNTLDLGLVPDDPELLRQAFLQASTEADLLICSGGVSVGQADFTRQVLTELGQVQFWQVAIKPGKPFAFGKLGQCWFFGLPGNPVSAAITFQQLVLPVLQQAAGVVALPQTDFYTTAAADFRKKPGRLEFQRARFSGNEETGFVVPAASQSSAALIELARADTLVVLPAEGSGVKAKEQVLLQPLAWCLG